MRKLDSDTLDDVIADAASLPRGLTVHRLGNGSWVSFLYDGDEVNRDTCQWRVVALDRRQLGEVVEKLMELLTRRGISCGKARFGSTVCTFQDRGPWKNSD